MNRLASRYVAPLIVLAAPLAQAQLVDDLELAREGADAVLHVRFVTPVQYRRTVEARSGDALQVFYDAVPNRDLPPLVVSERRLRANGALPEIRVTDESAGRDNSLSRRLVLRLGRAVPMHVRAGRGDRTIDVVLTGLGPTVARTTQAPAAAAAQSAAQAGALAPGQGYRIALLQSDQPVLNLDTPIPASLDRYQVYSGQRQVDGKTVYEVSLGDFATLTEAEAVRQQLARRFPGAAIVTPTAAATVATAPAAPATPAAPTPATTAVPEVAAASAASASQPVPPTAADAPALLAEARAADARGDDAAALAALDRLLNLPANPSTREGQALAGDLRAKTGDVVRARAEYETFLQLYPQGADADRVRQALAALPPPAKVARVRPKVEPSTTLTGSLSAFYYGGQSKVRTQEFQDSPVSGLPELASDSTLAGTDQKQVIGNADVNWRYRDDSTDMRFVFRDSYTDDQLRSDKSRNRLSALYFEHRALQLGTSIKLGRQSPTGGGVLSRFDGVQAGYSFTPKWRVNAVAGVPTDSLLDAHRHFYGAWVDADSLISTLGASLYVNQQVIDGAVDRRAVGTELRYFSGGVSMTSQLDYDQMLRGLNIASLQGTWQREDNTVINVLYDRRATPLLSLGNALFFGSAVPAPTALDPNATRLATSIGDLLNNGYTLPALRSQVKATTTYTTQGLLGITTPVSKNWQVGGDLRLTRLGDIPPIPDILPNGQGRSDNRAAGLQIIGTNLYSARDTHVISLSLLKGSSESLDPTLGTVVLDYTGQLVSYNNSSQVTEFLLLEPSIKFYSQSDSSGVKTQRVGPGLRVTYRVGKQVSLESELSGEYSKVSGPLRHETAHRVFYYLGSRYDF